jgi:hypothetical protein
MKGIIRKHVAKMLLMFHCLARIVSLKLFDGSLKFLINLLQTLINPLLLGVVGVDISQLTHFPLARFQHWQLQM